MTTGVIFGTSEPAVGLAQREVDIGRRYDGFHDYCDGGFTVHPFKHPGYRRFETVSSGAHAQGVRTWVQDCNAGRLDAAIRAKRDSITSPELVAIWQEMNGHWMNTNAAWIGGAANFVKAFQRAATILRGNPLIEIGWAPNVYGFPGSAAEDPAAYYPGPSFLDTVVGDGYCRTTYHTFAYLFGPLIGHYGPNGTRHKHKFVVGETAAQKAIQVNGQTRPDLYIKSFHTYLLANPGVVSEAYIFDKPWLPDGYNVDATPAELAEWKATVNDPKLRAAA